MKLYNTKTRMVEEFIPNNPKSIKMYTCGPTVYNFAHVGNLRCYIEEDVLEKSLNFLGFPVDRCMNITDVGHLTSDADSGEDKMEKAAKREGKNPWDIADFYIKTFMKDIEALNQERQASVANFKTNTKEYKNTVDEVYRFIEILKNILKEYSV